MSRRGGELPICAVMMIKDGCADLGELGEFLSRFSEVVVVDDGSHDGTGELARSQGYTVIDGSKLYSFAEKRAAGIAAARAPWVLMVDADERPMDDFLPRLAALIADEAIAGYEVCFRTYFGRDWLQHGAVYPLWVLRLFRREAYLGFVGSVHERVQIAGAVCRSDLEFIHRSYVNTSHYLMKINRYTDQEALELSERAYVSWFPPMVRLFSGVAKVGARVAARGFSKAVVRDELKNEFKNRYVVLLLVPMYPAWRFAYLYGVRGGFRDGFGGLRYAALSAVYSLVKLVKFAEIRRGEAGTRTD